MKYSAPWLFGAEAPLAESKQQRLFMTAANYCFSSAASLASNLFAWTSPAPASFAVCAGVSCASFNAATAALLIWTVSTGAALVFVVDAVGDVLLTAVG